MQFSSLIHVLDQFLIDTHRACSAQVFQFSLPPNPSLGDVCINIFGAVKATRVPPPVLSQEVLDVFLKQSYVTGGNIQGGFVNLFVTDDFFRQELRGYHLPVFTPRSETVIVDYIGANIGKPLHIGHLCTPLFGQAIINLLRRMGYAVIGDMHQGDWGGIFGKLITGWKYFGDTAKFESGPVSHLLEIYVKITEEIEQEDNVDQECRDAFRLLSEGDEASVRLWQQFTDKSLAAVRMIMGEFGVHPDIWVGESFYEGLPLPKLGDWPDLLPDNTMSLIVRELVDLGVATANDDGSVGIIFDPAHKQAPIDNADGLDHTETGKLPSRASGYEPVEYKTQKTGLPSCILQKRDGTHGYLASDLAAIKYRLKNWSPSRIIYCVDNRQALHFKQLFESADRAWSTRSTCELTHAANGFVSLLEGAMSTRKGRIILLDDLVQESYDRVKAILVERGKELSDADIRAVALGAIVYSFMSQDRERDWIFEWDKVLAFDGNSGPYLQYTYVRFHKMLQEFGFTKNDTSESSISLTPYDRDLILDILAFDDILLQCADTYKFHLLIAHLTTTARHLNALYVNTPKLKDSSPEERNMRMQIIAQALEMIRYACEIVSIPLPSQM